MMLKKLFKMLKQKSKENKFVSKNNGWLPTLSHTIPMPKVKPPKTEILMGYEEEEIEKGKKWIIKGDLNLNTQRGREIYSLMRGQVTITDTESLSGMGWRITEDPKSALAQLNAKKMEKLLREEIRNGETEILYDKSWWRFGMLPRKIKTQILDTSSGLLTTIDVKSDLKEAKLNKHKKIIPRPAPRENRMGLVYETKRPKKKVPIPPVYETDIVNDAIPISRNKPIGFMTKQRFKWKDFLVWNLLPIILGSILGWELTGFIIHIK